MLRFFHILLGLLLTGNCFSQYNWKLEKNEQGIRVYAADVPHSDFKAIKVEATFTGDYTKLINILWDVSNFSNWIYHSKKSKLLQKRSANEYIYHTETLLPWPISNREAVIRVQFNTDSLPALLTITGTGLQGLLGKTDGLVRVNQYKASWRVTMPAPKTLQIRYEITLDPGGSIPGWIANMFVTRGPFETFVNLAKKLKE
ncbi:MAG: START domain-containing protein [Ferruginibacter sp.]